jgi:hypothetical protein
MPGGYVVRDNDQALAYLYSRANEGEEARGLTGGVLGSRTPAGFAPASPVARPSMPLQNS